MSQKLEGSKTYEVPVNGGFKRKIEVTANSYAEAERKVEASGHKIDQSRFGNEK